MAIKEDIQLITEAHMVRHVFTDHFGHKHEVKYPTHVGKDADPKRPFPIGGIVLEQFDPEPQLASAREMMKQREHAFLHHCIASPHLANHAKVLSHPDHPNNSGKALPPEKSKDCWGCK